MPNDLGNIVGNLIQDSMFGIDVSHHQGKIDWLTVAKSTPKVDFAYIKASTGIGSQDPRAFYNATEAKRSGIKIGYYHFCSLNDKNEIEDATEEARWFIKVIKNLPSFDMPLVLDIEDNNPNVHLDPNEVVNWIGTFFKTLEASGVKDYAIYSYTSFLDEHLPHNHTFGNIKLWIAQYRSTLTLPRGWNKSWLWQYSAEGRINGISTVVDLNKQ